MSLLQSIVEELESELTRLQTLRKIVAGLTRTPALVRRYTEPASKPASTVSSPRARKAARPASAVTPAAKTLKASKPPKHPKAAKVTRQLRKDAGARRSPDASKTAEAPRALARVVPSGPVVFYPGKPSEVAAPEVDQNSLSAVAPHPVDQPPIDLDAQSRQLAARWGAGPAL